MVVQENRVGRRYFSTVGMTIVAGRDFTARDIGSSARDRDRQRGDGAQVFQGSRSDRPTVRLRQARHRDHRRGARCARATRCAKRRCRWRSTRSMPTPSYVGSMHVRSQRRSRDDRGGDAQGAAGDRAEAAGRSRHDRSPTLAGEHAAAGAADRAADHRARRARAGAGVPRALRIDGLRGEAAHRRSSASASRSARRGRACCGWCSANR